MLKSRVEECKKLRLIWESKPESLGLPSDSVTCYLGDGYFVDLNLPDAKRFVERQENILNIELAAICEHYNLSEDGLPIVDIVEEIDENDNVISSHVGSQHDIIRQLQESDTQLALNDAERLKLENLEQASDNAALANVLHEKDDLEAVSSRDSAKVPECKSGQAAFARVEDHDLKIEENVSVDAMPPSKTGGGIEIKSTTSSIGLNPVIALDYDLNTSNECTTNAFETIETLKPLLVNGITHEDKYELQLEDPILESLVDDKYSSEDGDNIEEGNVIIDRVNDVEAADVEVADDDDDDDDENEDDFGRTGGSLFPQTKEVYRLLEQSAEKLPLKSNSDVPAKCVRFSNSPEIKEFETTAEERRVYCSQGYISATAQQLRNSMIEQQLQQLQQPLLSQQPASESKLKNSEPMRFQTMRDSPKSKSKMKGKSRKQSAEDDNDSQAQQVHSPTTPFFKFAPSMAAAAARFVTHEPTDKSSSNSRIKENTCASLQSKQTSPQKGSSWNFKSSAKAIPSMTISASTLAAQRSVEISKLQDNPRSSPSQSLSPQDVVASENRPTGSAEGSSHSVLNSKVPAMTINDAPSTPESDQAFNLEEVERLAMRYYEEASLPDDEFLKLHGSAAGTAVSRLPASPESKLQGSVLSEVVEHDTVDFGLNNFQKTFEMNTIKKRYQKLRQKLVHKSSPARKIESESPDEPLDEDGNPVKMSKFMASRLGIRRN